MFTVRINVNVLLECQEAQSSDVYQRTTINIVSSETATNVKYASPSVTTQPEKMGAAVSTPSQKKYPSYVKVRGEPLIVQATYHGTPNATKAHHRQQNDQQPRPPVQGADAQRHKSYPRI